MSVFFCKPIAYVLFMQWNSWTSNANPCLWFFCSQLIPKTVTDTINTRCCWHGRR